MKGAPLVVALVLAGVTGLARPARGQCSVSTTPLGFGSYDVFLATPHDDTATLTVSCTSNTRVQVTLSSGSSGTFTPRTMRQGSEVLSYNLYHGADRTVVWGDGSGGTAFSWGFARRNRDLVLTIYGRIPPGQDVRAGPYADSVTAVIDF